ncbi:MULTISPECIES: FAD-dependent protein [unclassified Clostridium]|uniref:NAD(P)/FAD-dependent oxidoreductase n=1 Tax=unclassified Clostridium TaxID=2614128 RepID=UPI00189AC56B|nr:MULTISPECIES: FAD-dependent oxidoreductase [unclassified Clostridium]MCR1952132.1 FAD-dependent oxidoreductase [Clostridium sp. DSM 100503]
MSIRVNNIALKIDEDKDTLIKRVSKKLKISESEIKNIKIIKESLDARKKNDIKYIYCVEVEHKNEEKLVNRLKDKDVKFEAPSYNAEIVSGDKELKNRPVVVGFGPAGIFAALLLAEKGYKPLVIERGEDVDKRTETVDNFWKTGELNTESNVQFGEGGAGAFSDGKLTTRIKDTRCDYVLRELVRAGAPEEITYVAKPHVGTDLLKGVVKNIREKIKELGGEVLFSSKLEDIKSEDGRVKSIIVNGKEIECENLIIAIGHSSRDTYEMLHKRDVFMQPKAFAIGVRIEHPQELINKSQYGDMYQHPKLKAAEYRLTYQSEKLKRAVYSFCMCPGGVVVAAASENERLVSNGMSYHARDLANANSALVVTVGPEDFEGDSPLRGMEFQRHYESLAYKLGGGKYKAPVQLVGDFMQDKVSTKLGSVTPSYTAGYVFKDLRECLPDYVIEALKEGIVDFDKKIKGYGNYDSILTGIETRTSAPVRMTRDENLQSISMNGLFPAGEGAGFAGGIISAAVDGLKVAEKIIQEYKPMK